MNRMEFMSILRDRLSDMPEGEREEAVQYYEDYLNDAGVENEQEVMEALGSPEQVALNIKAGLGGNSSCEYTERGYQAEKEAESDGISVRRENDGNKKAERNDNNTAVKIAIAILLCILLGPFVVPLVFSVIGVVFGLIVGLLGVWLGLLAVGILVSVSGFLACVLGLFRLFGSPLTGVLIIGIGLMLLGIGLLLTILMIWMSVKLFPVIFLGIVNLCRKPFEKRGKNKA